jgi:hypothetical protein
MFFKIFDFYDVCAVLVLVFKDELTFFAVLNIIFLLSYEDHWLICFKDVLDEFLVHI